MAAASTEIPACSPDAAIQTDFSLAEIVRNGLLKWSRQLPAWLFYDDAGSLIFEEITRLPEYYLTRIERGIFESHAGEIIAAAAGRDTLRILELGSGSADKTRLLLAAAVEHFGPVPYHPIDVSVSALEAARERLERELPEVVVDPLVADFTRGLRLDPCSPGERRLALFIGSSIGNFSPGEALNLLRLLQASLAPGDSLLLGVDLAPAAGGKTTAALFAAYDDPRGVTARFNKNMLARLNRELDSDFDLAAFGHQIRWNAEESRIEMHLTSLRDQTVRFPSLELRVEFTEGETIHTENSYKYREGEAESLLAAAGFQPARRWTDADGWFAVHLATRL